MCESTRIYVKTIFVNSKLNVTLLSTANFNDQGPVVQS